MLISDVSFDLRIEINNLHVRNGKILDENEMLSDKLYE